MKSHIFKTTTNYSSASERPQDYKTRILVATGKDSTVELCGNALRSEARSACAAGAEALVT
jgi:diaminopimelate epimerase